MKILAIPLAVAMSASLGGFAVLGADTPAMPPEWNSSYDTSVPYEVEPSLAHPGSDRMQGDTDK